MARHSPRCVALLLACTALVACAPEESTVLTVPNGVGTAALFDCADATVRGLHARDEQWNARVTVRDVARGRFETGDFGTSNVMGYRVRLVRRDAAAGATLSVRAAGPYFTDLGADRALVSFRTALAACLAQRSPIR